MARALLAALATLLLVGVMALLIVESRAVKEDYYVAHAERMRAIETTKNDLTAILQGSRGAFKDGRSTPTSVELAFARLSDNNLVLQQLHDPEVPDAPLQQQLVAYNAALTRFGINGTAFSLRQNALADALRRLQEESPAVVKDLRRFDLRIQSQNSFSLAIDIIEFASGQGRADPDRLAARIESMRTDATVEARAPGRLDDFVAAASAVLTEHAAAEAALESISNSTVADQLWALSDLILLENRRIVDRAERARLLLSVCSILLLVGVGFVMWRLQSSYRDLNKSNSELGHLNNSLEDRVHSRTEELTEAYDELQESQVQLVQAEKMSSLGELVAGISHEINTPLWYLINNATVVQERLTSISEFCKIAESMVDAVKSRQSVNEAVSRGLIDLDSHLQDGMTEDIDEAKDLIQDSIDGLEELTELAQSLKDFSRLDRAQQGEFSINDGLDKTLLIVKNKLKSKVTVHKHYEEVPQIECSPSQINQVFLNLITNAADAITESGEILVRTWAEGDNVCTSIADTGCGIPEDILAKVRNPFFTTKEVGKGTGLGLSIVDRIVTAHGGELKIESEAGKGTIMTVVLPIKSVAAEAVSDVDAAQQVATEAVAGGEAAEQLAAEASNDSNASDEEKPTADLATV